jgi:hypothetical protein
MIAEANWSYEQVKDEGSHGTMAEFTDAFVDHHSTYAHMYLHSASYRTAIAEDRSHLERALRPGGIGYRFVPLVVSWPRQAEPGGMLRLEQSWVNRNTSWCSAPFRLKLCLLDRDGSEVFSGIDPGFDPRPWVQGRRYDVSSRFALPRDLEPGEYRLGLALVDESGTPRVRLGIEGGDEQLRYSMGDVSIVPPGEREDVVQRDRSTRPRIPQPGIRPSGDARRPGADRVWTLDERRQYGPPEL